MFDGRRWRLLNVKRSRLLHIVDQLRDALKHQRYLLLVCELKRLRQTKKVHLYHLLSILPCQLVPHLQFLLKSALPELLIRYPCARI